MCQNEYYISKSALIQLFGWTPENTSVIFNKYVVTGWFTQQWASYLLQVDLSLVARAYSWG